MLLVLLSAEAGQLTSSSRGQAKSGHLQTTILVGQALLTLPGTSGQQATKVTLMLAAPWPTSIVDGRHQALLALLFAEAGPDLDVSQ